ncbi:MAG TPA: TspO/MBR family protein [Herpetosiphonaceae bacterium]
MNRDIVRQAGVVIGLVATLTVNALANILPLNGQTSGEISDRFPSRFTPAGYVFSIWSLIYVGLIAFAVWQALPAQRENPLLRRIGWPFVVSCGFNCAWLFAWHYNQLPISEILIIGLLVTLIVIYVRIRQAGPPASNAERWLGRAPFSLYLGWLTVATVANTSILLYASGWNGFGVSAETWAVALLVVGLAITAFISWRAADPLYALVIVWAYAGIVVKQQDAQTLAVAAGAGALIAAGLAAWSAWRSGKLTGPQTA